MRFRKENGGDKRVSFWINEEFFGLTEGMEKFIESSPLKRKEGMWRKLTKNKLYVPKCIAFPPELIINTKRIKTEQHFLLNNLQMDKILFGSSFAQYKESTNNKIDNLQREALKLLEHYYEGEGVLTPIYYHFGGLTQLELPSFERLISDCAKLKKLDEILKKLHNEGHRVLIFCQMTKMLDILEEYMAKKKYSFFRMDGRTQIAVRRDMINEFQTNPKVFVFLLSTRAGGLGVNLTGADTVIFYDNDWNPTMDAQATDRAHRIGQTKKVTVYRLLTEDTIEERILKRARQKQNVQSTVYSGGAFKADIFKQSDIVQLLYSEEDMKKLGQDNKKLLLDLANSDAVVRNDGDANLDVDFGLESGSASAALNKSVSSESADFGDNSAAESSFGKIRRKRGPRKKIHGKEGLRRGRGRVKKTALNDSNLQFNSRKDNKESINELSKSIFSTKSGN